MTVRFQYYSPQSTPLATTIEMRSCALLLVAALGLLTIGQCDAASARSGLRASTEFSPVWWFNGMTMPPPHVAEPTFGHWMQPYLTSTLPNPTPRGYMMTRESFSRATSPLRADTAGLGAGFRLPQASPYMLVRTPYQFSQAFQRQQLMGLGSASPMYDDPAMDDPALGLSMV